MTFVKDARVIAALVTLLVGFNTVAASKSTLEEELSPEFLADLFKSVGISRYSTKPNDSELALFGYANELFSVFYQKTNATLAFVGTLEKDRVDVRLSTFSTFEDFKKNSNIPNGLRVNVGKDVLSLVMPLRLDFGMSSIELRDHLQRFLQFAVHVRNCFPPNMANRDSKTRVVVWKAFDELESEVAPVPLGLTNVTSISAGSDYIIALKADGRLVAWQPFMAGTNHQIIKIPEGATNIIRVSAGHDHVLALRSDGTVLAWGNCSEELKQFAAKMKDTTHVEVPRNLSNVIKIFAGSGCNYAVKRTGEVVSWGLDILLPVKGQLTNAVVLPNSRLGPPDAYLTPEGNVVFFDLAEYMKSWRIPLGLEKCVDLVGGSGSLTYALRIDGSVVAFPIHPDFVNERALVSQLRNVIAVASSTVSVDNILNKYGHTLILNANGQITSWSTRHNDNLAKRPRIPQMLTIPVDIRNCIAVAAGPGYSVALCSP